MVSHIRHRGLRSPSPCLWGLQTPPSHLTREPYFHYPEELLLLFEPLIGGFRHTGCRPRNGGMVGHDAAGVLGFALRSCRVPALSDLIRWCVYKCACRTAPRGFSFTTFAVANNKLLNSWSFLVPFILMKKEMIRFESGNSNRDFQNQRSCGWDGRRGRQKADENLFHLHFLGRCHECGLHFYIANLKECCVTRVQNSN